MTASIFSLLIGLSFGALFSLCAYIIGRSHGFTQGRKIGSKEAWGEYKTILIAVKNNVDRLAADMRNSVFDADKELY